MRKFILYIDSMQKGGAQRVMSVIADYLTEKGHEVVLINDIVPAEGVPEYEINPNVKRIFLDDSPNKGLVLKNLHRIIKLRRAVVSEKPDSILSFLGPPNIRMLLSTVGLKIRKVVSVRNDPYREYGTGLKGFLSKLVFLLADSTVFQTSEASDYFTDSVRKKSTVIPNPVSDAFYQKEWTGNGRNMAAVGRLQPQKNYPLLIRAFASISDKFPDTGLDIYGDGSLKKDMENLCKELKIADRVKFHGVVSNIPEILADSKVFVMSSDYEGMPNALMEAMAVGVPVISTDCPCGGPKELTESGKYGILVPCGDAEKLANALSEMLSSGEMLNRYHNGAKIKAGNYKTGIIMKQWCDILDDAK